MSNQDKETIRKFEEIIEQRRQHDPFNVEFLKIVNSIFPIDKLYDMFKFGEVNMLSIFKKYFYDSMDKYDKKMLDDIIEEFKKDNIMRGYIEALIENKNE
jgi:hypothetical protein